MDAMDAAILPAAIVRARVSPARIGPEFPIETYLLNSGITLTNTFHISDLWDALDSTTDKGGGGRRLSRFPQFRCLPLELRLQIWEYALPPRRTVAIIERLAPDDQGRRHPQKTFIVEAENELNPALLFVNSEARRAALARYQLSFTDITCNNIYFDPFKDDLHLLIITPTWAVPYAKTLGLLKEIRNLTLNYGHTEKVLRTLLQPFENLQTLTLPKTCPNEWHGRDELWKCHLNSRALMRSVFRFVRNRRVDRMVLEFGFVTTEQNARAVWKVMDGEDPDIVFWDSWPLTDNADENRWIIEELVGWPM